MWKYACLSFLLLAPAGAADHPNLAGKWLLDAARSQIRDSKLKSESLDIAQNEDEVAVSDAVDTGGKQEKIEYKCLADGNTCKAKNVSVMVYYNGPTLVVLEMRKNNEIVVKKRITASDDGKTLNVSVNHVAPQGLKDETLIFVKQ